MRVLLKLHVDPAKGSAAIKDGSMQRTMEEFMSAVHPEAAYSRPTAGFGRPSSSST